MTEEEQRLAVRQYGCAIKFIKNPSEELKKLAIERDPEAIKYIENPSEELQLLALKNDSYPIIYIENPTKRAIFEHFSHVSKRKLSKSSTAYLGQKDFFLSLILQDKRFFLSSIPSYQEIIKEGRCFTVVLQYLINFHTDWIEEFMNNLQPLTKEQEDIWKQIRLKALF